MHGISCCCGGWLLIQCAALRCKHARHKTSLQISTHLGMTCTNFACVMSVRPCPWARTHGACSCLINSCSIVRSVKLPLQILWEHLIVKKPSCVNLRNCSVCMSLGAFSSSPSVYAQTGHMLDGLMHGKLEPSVSCSRDADPSHLCVLHTEKVAQS